MLFLNTSPSSISNLVLYSRSILDRKRYSCLGEFDSIGNKLTVDSNTPNAPFYREAMKARRESVRWISLAVALAVDARFSTGGTDRGG